MLRTGRPLSGREAVECGLVRAEIDGDVVEAAVVLARAAALDEESIVPIDPRPLAMPSSLPPVELGHRSRVVDALICRAILEGCAMPLAEGLRFESEMFGACCATADMHIGVLNFQENGPRSRAVFVNH
jgi:enoyl-CoA hydratase/3-hydroxyacyl-CoA dehydrogenase